MKQIFFFALAILLLASCKKNKDVVSEADSDAANVEAIQAEADSIEKAKQSKAELIRYGRTPCFGMCPYFNLIVFANGDAIYEGKNFVDLIGLYHTTFDKADLQKVLDTADRIGYFGFQDEYDNTKVTDLPTITTGLLKGKDFKLVQNRYHGPKELKELYDALDELIKNAKWEAAGE